MIFCIDNTADFGSMLPGVSTSIDGQQDQHSNIGSAGRWTLSMG
jgi:hypothetical protein